MNEHPILFSGEMVRAILDGRKMKTRRVIKPQPDTVWHDTSAVPHTYYDGIRELNCPYGQPGDLLWVRETWGVSAFLNKVKPSELKQSAQVSYRVDATGSELSHFVWRPSIFMPRWASRITLEVTGVQVERLNDISEEDARAEGVHPNQLTTIQPYRAAFCGLWDSINEKRGYGWLDNPWVWVVEFKVKETK